MKLLVILASDEHYASISGSLRPLGFELIRYRYAIKAMDNIDEIDPGAIIICAQEFPRHWKTLVQFIRAERSETQCPVILLIDESFSDEEASKALFLKAGGTAYDTPDNHALIECLSDVLKRNERNEEPEPYRTGMLIADLCGKAIISGNVSGLSSAGLSFTPGHALPLIDENFLHQELRECSLRLDDSIFSPVCRITGIAKDIDMEFVSFPGDEQVMLESYIQ